MDAQKILQETNIFQLQIKRFKSKSEYYPKIHFEEITTELYASTLVRINYFNKWYVIHCMECIQTNKDLSKEKAKESLLLNIIRSTHMIQHCHIPIEGLDELDNDQTSERDRLLKSGKQF